MKDIKNKKIEIGDFVHFAVRTGVDEELILLGTVTEIFQDPGRSGYVQVSNVIHQNCKPHYATIMDITVESIIHAQKNKNWQKDIELFQAR